MRGEVGPQQRNLINNEWRVVSIKKLPNRPDFSTPSLKSAGKATSVKGEERKNQFEKADLQLFKKLSSVGEPKNNP